jgi:hypothetical protein
MRLRILGHDFVNKGWLGIKERTLSKFKYRLPTSALNVLSTLGRFARIHVSGKWFFRRLAHIQLPLLLTFVCPDEGFVMWQATFCETCPLNG